MRFEASEFILKNSISSFKLVVCGEIWFHSFYNFLPFFPFSSFALLIYFHWRHSLDIFLSLHFFSVSLLFYIINTLQMCDAAMFSTLPTRIFASVRVFKKRSFFWPTFTHSIQYIIHVLYIQCTKQIILQPGEIIEPIRHQMECENIFGKGWGVGSGPVIYWNVQVINLRK